MTLLPAVGQQGYDRQDHHGRGRQHHRVQSHLARLHLVLGTELLLWVMEAKGSDEEGHVGEVEAQGEGRYTHRSEEGTEGDGCQHGGLEGNAVIDETVDQQDDEGNNEGEDAKRGYTDNG